MKVEELEALVVGDLVTTVGEILNHRVVLLGGQRGMTQAIVQHPSGYLRTIHAGVSFAWTKVTPFFEVGKTYGLPRSSCRYKVTALHTTEDHVTLAISESRTFGGRIVVITLDDSDFESMKEVK